MSISAETDVPVAAREGQARTPVAAVVDPTDTGAPAYAMFAACRVTGEGAFLSGQLFFEVEEQFTIQLSLGQGRTLQTRARVVRVDRGDAPGMEVRFHGLTDEDKATLSELGAATAES